jgi:hypothetical protein
MQLKPGEQFTIVRQLDNPADSGTYYVQAVIRNSKTDEIIQTLNLEDKGNQRFTKNWQVISDSSGLGLYIDIESRVFTDSNHTTYSDIYAKENKVYLIDERNSPNTFGGGMGSDVDYTKIRRIMKEEIDGRKQPKNEKVDMTPILAKLSELGTGIKGIKQEKTDISPILSQIKQLSIEMGRLQKNLENSIAEKEVTPETDITPVMEKIETLDPKNFVKQFDEIVEKIRKIFLIDIETISNKVTDMHDMIGRAPFIPLPSNSINKKVELPKTEQRIRKI